jgi:pyridoxal phosphate enzyme (YggS family)
MLEIVARNLQRIRDRVAQAAGDAGRLPDEVTLVAVTKYVGLDETRAVLRAGCRDLGESRPQQLWTKAAALADDPPRWHLIGPLQRNKIRHLLPHVSLIHSGESLRLLQAIDRVAGEMQLVATVLLEVNISGDATKHGFAPAELDDAEPLLGELRRLSNVRVQGLMAMAGLDSSADQSRRQFAELRRLRDRLQAASGGEIAFDQLSMGMSDDFEQAIAEGATIIRVGSALFEGLA